MSLGLSQEPISGKCAGPGPSLFWHWAPRLAGEVSLAGSRHGVEVGEEGGSSSPATERPRRPSQRAGLRLPARSPRATCLGRR